MNIKFGRFDQRVLILCFSMGICTTSYSESLGIEVFTETKIDRQNISGVTIDYYALDAPERLEDTLPSFGGNAAVSSEQAKKWLEQNGEKFATAMKVAQQGRIKSLEYQLTHIPAVVFGKGQYVVYGTTDVRAALIQYHAKKDDR